MPKSLIGLVPAVLIVVQLACNLPGPSQPEPPQQDLATPPPALPVDVPSNTPQAVAETATVFVAPQDPLVLRSTLCWQGPGPDYFVVSGLKNGDRVKLLGRGSLPGWYVIENPTYHDPCWVQEADLQIDPGTDLLSLKIYNPPPKPTPTKVPTKKPSKTPTP